MVLDQVLGHTGQGGGRGINPRMSDVKQAGQISRLFQACWKEEKAGSKQLFPCNQETVACGSCGALVF